jgi:hypothetical protein
MYGQFFTGKKTGPCWCYAIWLISETKRPMKMKGKIHFNVPLCQSLTVFFFTKRFQALLFSNKEPKNFKKCISTLNKFLIFYFNLTNKRDLNMSSNFLSPISVVQKKSTVNVDTGLDQIVRYLSKTFKVQKMLLFNWLKLI